MSYVPSAQPILLRNLCASARQSSRLPNKSCPPQKSCSVLMGMRHSDDVLKMHAFMKRLIWVRRAGGVVVLDQNPCGNADDSSSTDADGHWRIQDTSACGGNGTRGALLVFLIFTVGRLI